MSDPSTSTDPPVAFIVYAWEDEELGEWVKALAIRLRLDGIDVKLDRWEAQPGSDLTVFMQDGVKDSDFVLLVCTPSYKERFDERQKGVGFEARIITGEIYLQGDKGKFIPILRRGEWSKVAPALLARAYFVDLRGDPFKESNYQDLLSTLKGARPAAPPLGAQYASVRAQAPAATSRPRSIWRYQVVGFDLDATLIWGPGFNYSWRRIWDHLALNSDTHRQMMRLYMEHRITYDAWCKWVCDRFIEKNLTRDQFAAILGPLRLTKNCLSTLQTLKNEGFTLALISGGVDTFLEMLIPDYQKYFDYVFINRLEFDNHGRLCGVTPTEFDFEGKALALETVCQEAGCTTKEAVFVGEGMNDYHVIRRAGLSIAYPPTVPEVEIYSNEVIREDDLSLILPYIRVS